MFKKSLLAITIASATFVAQAGTIYSTVTTEGTVAATLTTGVGTPQGTNAALLGGDDDCLLAAAALGVTASLGAFTNSVPAVAGVSDGDDAITAVAPSNALNSSSVAFTANNACTVTIGDTKSTATAKSPIEAPAGSVNFSAAIVSGIGGYVTGDTISINMSGAKIDVANSVTPVLAPRSGGATVTILDITATAVRFTVTAGTITSADILDLSGIVLDSTGLSTSSVVALDVFATNTSGTKFDVIAATAVAGLVPQYSAVVDFGYNAVVNVSADRQSLLASAATDAVVDLINTDTLHVDVDLDATTNDITPDVITFAIKGNFAWLAKAADMAGNDNGTTTAAEVQSYLGSYLKVDGGAYAAGDSASLNALNDTLTITDTTGGVVGSDYYVKLTVPGEATGNPVLVQQTFSVSVSVDDGVASPNTNVMTAATNLDAGAWTLNGSVVEVPYMPFGPNTQPILRHTNTGVQTGDISVRYMEEGVDTTWQSLGIVVSDAAPGMVNLLTPVMNAVTAATGSTSGKVALEITTNVPGADVTVFAAAKITTSDSDRLTIGAF